MPGLPRRALARLLPALFARPDRARAAGPDIVPSPLLSMAEIRYGERDSADLVQRRFELYRALGCGGLRTGLGWRELERREGEWRVDGHLATYYALAAKAGFRLKCQIGPVSSVPDWFLDKHPDARLLNQRGDAPHGYISPWYPDASRILGDTIERLFATAGELGILDLADAVIVDLGPAGEPTYPAAWHMGRGYTPGNSLFWYFDANAARDFSRAMRLRYADDLARANRTWGTRFGAWAEVTPPVPGTIKGPVWIDLLRWYFEAKRRLICEQIERVSALLARHAPTRPIRKLLLLPGDHATPEDWALTARDGIGTYLVKIAADTEFVIDAAARHDCWLQYG
jgi:hypothetical protein